MLTKMVDIAGLTDQVTVIVGAFADQYQLLKGKTVDVSAFALSYEKLLFTPIICAGWPSY